MTIEGRNAGGYTPGTSTPGHNETSTYSTTERINANQVQPAASNTTNTYWLAAPTTSGRSPTRSACKGTQA